MSTDTIIERPTSDELRGQLLEAADKLREIREKKPEELTDDLKRDARDTFQLIDFLDHEHKVASLEEEAQARAALPEARGPEAAFQKVNEYRTPGAVFTESDEYKNRRGMASDDVEVRTLLTEGDLTSGGGLFAPRGTPLPPSEQRRRLFVRDLLSVQQTGLSIIPYIRESSASALEGGASAVGEASAKPEVTASFTGVDATVRKIAAWIPVTEEIVSDAPTLMGYIDRRLRYMLAIREEFEILNGTGTAPRILGILPTSGVQTQAAVTGDYAATLGRAIGKIESVDGDADGIVMNPTDFWVMLTSRFSTQFDGGFGGNLPFTGAVPGVWGVPVVRTRGVTSGTAIVGSWALGATLFDRMQATVRTTDSHDDYFIYNKWVILAEERVALAVHRPDFFVNTTLS